MKNVVISGAGEVGRYAAQVARKDGLKVTIIENSPKVISQIENMTDARIVEGSACHADTLRKAEIEQCDILMAATSLDEVNLLSASIGKRMGAKKVMARIHNTAYFDGTFDYRESFGIDHFVCPEQLTAKAIVSDLDLTEPHSAKISRFAQNEIEIRNLIVSPKSNAINVPLKNLELPPGVRIVLIKRSGTGIAPDASTMLKALDKLSIIGPGDTFKDLLSLFGREETKVKKLAISGAGPITEWLLKKIDHKRYQIKIFEKDLCKAEYLAAKYRSITMINDDPMEADTFQGEHLENCSSFLSLGKNQEHNIIGAMQAKTHGVPNVIALIQSMNFLRILKDTRIDHLYSPRIEAAKSLRQVTDKAQIRVLARLDYKISLVYQVRVQENCWAIGRELASLGFPKTSFIAAIDREGSVLYPIFSDSIKKGDVLIIIGPQGIKDYFKRTFIEKKELIYVYPPLP